MYRAVPERLFSASSDARNGRPGTSEFCYRGLLLQALCNSTRCGEALGTYSLPKLIFLACPRREPTPNLRP